MPLDDTPRSLESEIVSLARALARTNYPTGDHAALRRMDPGAPAPAALPLYRLLAEAGIDVRDDRTLKRWALIVHCLALTRGRYDRTAATGKRLHDIGLTEARLNQALSADEDVLFDLLPRLARRIAAQGAAIDWKPLAQLVLFPGDDAARLSIARSFARAQRAQT